MWSPMPWWWRRGCHRRHPGVLGTAVGDSESFEFWREFPGRVAGTRSFGRAPGRLRSACRVEAAVTQQFSGAYWQRCRVHFMRNFQAAFRTAAAR
ncbi:transposase [Rhodococcus gordoniae]|uniref:transposase n=1 Tax=Rhodococcus gordoniae TaxID=223392 RepID=UPI0034C5BD7D